MSSETIALLELIWLVISGIATAAWVAVPIIWPWFKRRHLEWQRPQLEASQRGAKDLERLVRLLGQVEEWLRGTQTELVMTIRHDLWRVAVNVYFESLSYIAVHSDDDSKRISALWKLSQVGDGKSIEEIKDIVQGVIRDKGASTKVRKVAEAVLKELEERQEMDVSIGKRDA